MRDMDDCISHIYLFSRMPSNLKNPSNLQVRKCARLVKEWEHYIAKTHAVRKVFVSIKGNNILS
jgi:pescadillo protein